MIKNYKEAKRYLSTITRIDPGSDKMVIDSDGHKVFFGGLSRMEELLSRLGNPEKNLKIIHVVGTAGKGSVCNWTKLLLNRWGFKVGLFLSPHITTQIERISINDLLISDSEFVVYLNKIIPHIKKMDKHYIYGKPMIFEVILAMAFMYFNDNNTDYVVLEAGMGGKYDATNVISHSELSILTSIGLDHQFFLGDIKMIARDKSSIMDKSKKIVLFKSVKSVNDEIVKNANKFSSEVFYVPEEFSKYYDSYLPFLHGDFQLRNLVLAIYSLRILGFNPVIDLDLIRSFKLPLRCEQFSEKPLVILDGSHNIMKIEALICFLKKNHISSPIFVYSTFLDKDFEDIIKIICKHCSSIIFTKISLRGRLSPSCEDMKKVALKYLPEDKIYLEPNNLRSYKLSKKLSNEQIPIVVAGSFHHTAKIRELNWPEEKILFERKII